MNKYFLHINEPCQQDWNSMTATQQGKFCNSCSKEVIDFTSYSDYQLLHYFKLKTEEEVCGRFQESQLSHWIEETNLKKSHPQIYKILLSMVLLVGSQNIHAQEVKKPVVAITNNQIADKIKGLNVYKTQSCDSTKTKPNCRIRMGAVSSISGNQTPLLIVDGIIQKFSTLGELKPSEIKSINVLKSGESTAIYGSEGVNGAIILETKKCKETIKDTPHTSLF